MSVVRRIAVGQNHRSAEVLNQPTDDIITGSGLTLGGTFPGFATKTEYQTLLTGSGYAQDGTGFAGFALAVVINVKDVRYGAKGDGTTDDTAAFRAALAAGAAVVAGGGRATVFVPKGTYPISAYLNGSPNILTVQAGVSIEGEGYDSLIKVRQQSVSANGSWRLFYYESTTAFRRLRFYGSRDEIIARTPSLSAVDFTLVGWSVTTATDLAFEDLWVQDVMGLGAESFGVAVGGSSGATASRFVFRRCEGWRCQGTPFSIAGPVDLTAADPFVSTTAMTEKGEVSDIIGRDNDWAGITFFGCRNIRASRLHTYGNTQGGFNVEWAKDLDVFDLVSHDNGYAGVTMYGRASARFHNPTLYNNNSATGTNGEYRLIPYAWGRGTPPPYGNMGTVEIHGGSCTPVTGGRHIFYRPDNSVNRGSSVPDRILLDVADADQWTFFTDVGSDKILPCLRLSGVQLAAPVYTGPISGWTASGGASLAAYVGVDRQSTTAQTITSTTQFGNVICPNYVFLPNRVYFLHVRVKINDTCEWRFTHQDASNNKPQAVLLPYSAQDVGSWFEFDVIFAPSSNQTRPLFLCNGVPSGTSSIVADVHVEHEVSRSVYLSDTPAPHTASTVVASTSAQIGTNGTVLTQVRVYSFSWTPASVGANTTANQTVTVSGLTTADTVFLNPPDLSNACAPIACRVSAADTLKVYFNNPTAGALTPISGTYKLTAVRS